MENMTKDQNVRDLYIKKAESGFKTVIDFYRMEYSDSLTALFNDLGYLLICRLFYEGYFHQEIPNYEIQKKCRNPAETDSLDMATNDIEQRIKVWERFFRRFAPNFELFDAFIDYSMTIEKNSVLRHMVDIIDALIDWQGPEQEPDRGLLYDAVMKMYTMCINSKNEGERYVLPENYIKTLVQIMEDGPLSSHKTILDPAAGSGQMLLAAYKYMNNAKLYAFEAVPNLRITSAILCIFAGTVIHCLGENFLSDRSDRNYDFVLSNPPFVNENIRADMLLRDLPKKLTGLKSKYNFYIVRSLMAMDVDGHAAVIVPDSFLFSSKRENEEVRRWILETYRVEAILSLPSDTFAPYANVSSSIIVVSNPFMKTGGINPTEFVLFYAFESHTGALDAAQTLDLLNLWNQREYYYKEWERMSQALLENYNNIKTPEGWPYSNFWFAGLDTIRDSRWNLLPKHYQPAEQPDLKFEPPEKLLRELLDAQADIAGEMRLLLEEVEGL